MTVTDSISYPTKWERVPFPSSLPFYSSIHPPHGKLSIVIVSSAALANIPPLPPAVVTGLSVTHWTQRPLLPRLGCRRMVVFKVCTIIIASPLSRY